MLCPPCEPSSRISLHLKDGSVVIVMAHYKAQKNMKHTVIAKVAVQDRCQHQRLIQQLINPLFVSLYAHDAVLCERSSA